MASGNTLAVFTPYQNEPPSSAYATLDTRNGQPVLDFDADTDESAVFSGIAPSNYAGGGFTLIIHVAFSSAVAGDAIVDAQVERGSTDMDADSFAAVSSVTITANGTSGVETQGSVAVANMDSIVAGDHFRLKLTRDANNASDTATGDMEVRSVEVRET